MGQSLVPLIREYVDLDREVTNYRRSEIGELTAQHYDCVWRMFSTFMASRDVWKATPNDVARWIVFRVRNGVAPQTIYRDLHGLHYYFEVLGKGAAHGRAGKGVRPSPARDDLVRRVLRGVYRKHGRPHERKAPLLLDSLEKMLDHEPTGHLRGLRNRALFALAWGGAMRVNEIRTLDVTQGGNGLGWVETSDDGVIIHLRRSKVNRFGKHKESYAVPARHGAPKYCPVQLLRAWLNASGLTSGPLFPSLDSSRKPFQGRMHRATVRRLVKQSASAIGIDASKIAGQSLRSGCLTWLSMQNVNVYRIQEHSGHKDLRSLLYYIRRPKTAKDSPLTGTKWTE